MLIWLKKWNIIKHKIFLSDIKMGKEVITFGNVDIKKRKFHHYKNLTYLNDANVNSILIYNRIFSGI